MEYGGIYEGYWTYDKFAVQVESIMDVVEVLYPQMQLVFEVDHSSNHLKGKEDGLDVNAMNLNWGGKQKQLRASTVCAGCLGDSTPRTLAPKARQCTAHGVPAW